MSSLAAVVLAAGKGTRMKSDLPKVLHPVAGKPMLLHVLRTLHGLNVSRSIVVVPPDAEAIERAIDGRAETVVQREQLGTAHALLQTRDLLAGTDRVLVVCGDTPLISTATLRALLARHGGSGIAATLLTARPASTLGLGRVLRDESGDLIAIVEEKEATPEQLGIREVNTGVYCFETSWLWRLLSRVPFRPSGETYLTDVIAAIVAEGGRLSDVEALDPDEGIGINNRIQLAAAEQILRQRVRERLMLDGVTLIDPGSTFIDVDVQVGHDTVIHPGTTISGASRIGERCVIGPGTLVAGSVIGHNCRVLMSVVEDATLEDEVTVGPFSHLRNGAYLSRESHLGNFAEVKNSRLGSGTRMGHFSYLGDATLGQRVNVGAGTITCNFDGERKWPTTVGDDVFIGSDTMLVAPVQLGDGATTGAGSVVTRDVPPGVVVYGVPARPKEKTNKAE